MLCAIWLQFNKVYRAHQYVAEGKRQVATSTYFIVISFPNYDPIAISLDIYDSVILILF